jgi:hypothetical protein
VLSYRQLPIGKRGTNHPTLQSKVGFFCLESSCSNRVYPDYQLNGSEWPHAALPLRPFIRAAWNIIRAPPLNS